MFYYGAVISGTDPNGMPHASKAETHTDDRPAGSRAAPSELSRQPSEPAPAATALIVGAGPGGLFAACELLRHGVMPRVVERRLARRIARLVVPLSSRRCSQMLERA